jgi:hypothetical protein
MLNGVLPWYFTHRYLSIQYFNQIDPLYYLLFLYSLSSLLFNSFQWISLCYMQALSLRNSFCVCASVYVYMYLCVCERERENNQTKKK